MRDGRVWTGTVGGATRIINWVLEGGGLARYHDETSPPHIVVVIDGGESEICRPGDVVERRQDGKGFKVVPFVPGGIFPETDG
jgi:hypothetical protein